jgi:hypothetical protein
MPNKKFSWTLSFIVINIILGFAIAFLSFALAIFMADLIPANITYLEYLATQIIAYISDILPMIMIIALAILICLLIEALDKNPLLLEVSK